MELRMPSLSMVVVAGRVVADPELRHTPKGTAVLELRIAANRRWLDKAANEWKEEASFFSVNLWGEQAERVGGRARKGSAVFVEGELRQRSWEDKDGKKRSAVEILGRRVQVLDKAQTQTADKGRDADLAGAEDVDRLEDIQF